MKDREIYFTGHKSEWRKAFGVVAVPDGAAQLVLLLNVREQDPASVCWFDHVEVSKIK